MATLQTVRGYAHGAKHFVAGDIDYDANTILAALVLSTYTPSQAHEFFNTSVNAHEHAAEVAICSPITDDRELHRSIREIITTII